MTHARHQLLVAVKGHREYSPPTVGNLADSLLLRPHSAAELVDRAEAAGLVERPHDHEDGHVVRVSLTGRGDRMTMLTRASLDRLHGLAAVLDELETRRGDGNCPHR